MKRVVIVGAGFAGMYAAKNLLRLFKDWEVVLINRTNYFLFVPMLHEVATGSLTGHNIAEPIREVLKGKNFRFIKCNVNSIDLKKQVVKMECGNLGYDYLFITAGSKVNFFGTPGTDKYVDVLKTLHDARNIKNRIIENLERSFKATSKSERDTFSSVAIVGAGATGIELGIEVMELMRQITDSNVNSKSSPKVYLIQRGSEVLPQFPKLQGDVMRAIEREGVTLMTNSAVEKISKDTVHIKGGKKLRSATILWTAGVKPNLIKTSPKLSDKKGKVYVNEFLQHDDFKNVFVLGDYNTYLPPGERMPMPKLAQVASEQGKHAAANLYLLSKKRPMKPFKFDLRGIMMSLGKGKGVALVKGFKFGGFPAWFFLRTIYLFKIIGRVNRLKTAYEWTLHLFTKRDTTQD